MKIAEKPKKKRPSRKEKRLSKRNDGFNNKYGISEDYTGEEERFTLKMLSVVLRKKAINVIIMTVIFAVFLSALSCLNGQRECRATMMLNYEQSVEGLAPNGTRFNISDFKSEEVVTSMIKNAGLAGQISSEDFKRSITIQAIYSKAPTSEQNYYIPTSFKITLKKPMSIKGISANNLLQVICNTYSQYFYDRYTMNAQILNDDYDFPDDAEYSQVGSFLKMRIDAVSDYLQMRTADGGEFKSESTGETFNSIKKMTDNLKNYNLENFNAYIWENGIVHDKSNYTNTLKYLNSTNGRNKKLNMNEYLIRREVIEYYNSIMSTSILIPTVNSKNNYYMARTKTGVDYLASDAAFYLGTAKGLEKTIRTDTDKLSKVEKITDIEKHHKADIMIKDMTDEIQKVEALSKQVDKEYKEEYAKNYITFDIENRGLIGSIPKKKVALASMLFMLVAFYAYFVECRYIAKRGRTE